MAAPSTKIWNFLIPGLGGQEIRADNLGQADQAVFVNGEPQALSTGPAGEKQLVFTGPGGSFVEIKRHEKTGAFNLLIDGIIVEEQFDVNRRKGDQSLRELRSKPDGSYMIQTEIDVSHVEMNYVRRFWFCANGARHEVAVAHSEWVWQVVYDGKLVDRLSHLKNENNAQADFVVDAAPGQPVRACLVMEWNDKKWLWSYALNVNGVDIPMAWARVGGYVSPPPELPVILAAPEAAPPVAPVEEVAAPSIPDSLPQGVSYDSTTRSYQANIRSSAGKFVFLGEFATPDEAHRRYLEAIPIHCPDKRVM